jgi:DNA (cytosine-5)-methyltransferase 1
MNQSKLTLGSLFDGSGGFPLGGLISGITPVWSSEIEPFPVRVTTKRLPFMKHYGDVSALNGAELSPVDIITFGSPCQDMSIAGKRAGLEGSRSNLFYEAVRIVKEMRCATNGKYPRYIVWENVPGAFSSNKGDDFKAVLETVCSVKGGETDIVRPSKWPNAGEILADDYSVAWRVFDAQYWGVPQRRKRIYLVADFDGGSAGKILFESEGLSGYTPQGFRSWQDAPRYAGEGAEETGKLCLNDQGGERMDITEDVASTLRAEAHHPPVVMESAGFCTEHSAKSRSIGYEEEKSPTLRAEVVPAAVMFENHSQDTRYTGPLDVSQTVLSTFGTGGNNQPFVVENAGCYDVRFTSEGTKVSRGHAYPTDTARTVDTGGNAPDSNQGGVAVIETPKTLKMRSGCEGGGKGPLVQDDKSATLGTHNDQTVFVPRAYGICSKESNAMKSANPNSGFYEAGTSRTLDGNGGNPSCNQGGIAVVEGNGARPSHLGDGYKKSDVMYTLNATEQHGVAYGIDRATYNMGQNAQFDIAIREELEPTIVAKGPGAVAHPVYSTSKNSYHTEAEENLVNTLVATDYKDPPTVTEDPYYIVRRLTPVECARLQGFPDWWCADLGTENPTEEDVSFWREVFETHRKVIGTSSKPKTDAQIIKWLKEPHSDSAEYKLWGNGVALPCVCFVLAGIVYYSQFQGG